MYRQQRVLCVCLYNIDLWRIDVTESNETYLGLHIDGPIFLFEYSLTWFFLTGFSKIVQNQISQNLSSRNWADTREREGGRTDRRKERRRDLTQQIEAFRDLRNRV